MPTVVRSIYEQPLSRRFWPAFCAYIEELIEEDYLEASFGFQSSCGNLGGCDLQKLSRAVTQELGRLGWPIETPTTLSQADVLTLVEFFWSVIAAPVTRQLCGCCEQSHLAEADYEVARQTYNHRVNEFFQRFDQPFYLAKGKVIRKRSPILHDHVTATDFPGAEPHLAQLLRTAIQDFFNPREDRRLSGLQVLVDAFERIKSSQAEDKKRSTEQLIASISPDARIGKLLDDLFREHTKIGNEYTIRHHEPDKRRLTDEYLTEFLFFSYYNVIRLALRSQPGD